MFRVAQEALSNVAKHARASKVRLTLTYVEDELLLDIVDDGAGFTVAQNSNGYGLIGMRERLTKVGGRLTVESAPGSGTSVNAVVPLTAPCQEGPMTAMRLLIVDDHPIMRDGLRGVFTDDPDFEVVGEAADGAQALALAGKLEVDVILMDLRMPTMGGVEATTRLHESGHPARVLILTTYDADRDVLPAIEAGATGYLLKDAPRDELLRAVRAAYAGQPVLAPSVAGTLMNRAGARRDDALATALSPREVEVLRLVSDGATNQSAARQLMISETTVKTHLLHIYSKLGVRDRASAVATAYKRGLLDGSTTPGLWITSAALRTRGQTARMNSRPLEMTIRTDADVRTLWTSLVPAEERRRRSLWVALLDAADRTLPVAFPIDDLPAEPDALLCRNLAKILGDLASTGPARSAVLLLCRPGAETVTAQDRRWAARLRGELGTELCRRPVHLATTFGLHSLEADDLSAAS